MTPLEKIESLLGIVGLLRAKFSRIMKTIHDRREEYKANKSFPPEELGDLMAEAQEQFAELLKMGEFLSTTQGNIEETPRDKFDLYLKDWAISRASERLKSIHSFLVKLESHKLEGLYFDPNFIKEGLSLLKEASELL
jgi:hypothetical protein